MFGYVEPILLSTFVRITQQLGFAACLEELENYVAPEAVLDPIERRSLPYPPEGWGLRGLRFHPQAIARHRLGLRHAQNIQHCWRNVTEHPIRQVICLWLIRYIKEIHREGRVRGVGRPIGIAHEFAVPVIRGDEELAIER